MNDIKKVYSEIKNKYFEIKIIDIYKQSGVLLIFWLLILCLILFSIILILFFDKKNFNDIALISSGIFYAIIFFIVKYTSNHFIKKYPEYKDFFNSEQDSWRGCRYVLFFEKIKNIDYSQKEIINLIDSEIELKNFDVTKSVYALVLIPAGLMIFNAYISSRLIDAKTLLLTIIIYLIVYYFVHATNTLFRSKVNKLKELKYFLLLNNKK